jgi:hypothetical protein
MINPYKINSWVQIPPLRPLKINDLQGNRNTSVTKIKSGEAEKAREVMDLIRGLSAQKTAWLWGSR